jgi:threonine/homoserine/homoserine lactone efflux protein
LELGKNLPIAGGGLGVRDRAWPIAGQIVVLGLIHVASCAAVYTGVGTGARLLRARPTAARAVTRFSGTAMIVIGVVLLAEQLIG